MSREVTDPDRLEPDILFRILRHFHWHRRRAFDALELNTRIWDSDTHDDLMSLSTFYRIMNGEPAPFSKIERIVLRWTMYDKGSGIPKPLPEKREELKEWINAEFGSLRRAHELLFSDWKYPSLANWLKGIGSADRVDEIWRRLVSYRKAKIAEHHARRNDSGKKGGDIL